MLSFTHQVFAADPGIEGITAADFDGSGRPSLAYAAYRTTAGNAACASGGIAPTLCTVLDGNGWVSLLKLASGLGTVGVVAAGFTGDGTPDLAAGNFLAPGQGGISVFTDETSAAPRNGFTGRPQSGCPFLDPHWA